MGVGAARVVGSGQVVKDHSEVKLGEWHAHSVKLPLCCVEGGIGGPPGRRGDQAEDSCPSLGGAWTVERHRDSCAGGRT